MTFIGHDVRGAELAREVLARLRASERLRAHVAALVRHHLRLGFLVHEPQPLPRRAVYGYLRACAPVEVDVTLLSVADRLATRGDRAEEAIDAHLRARRRPCSATRCAGAPRAPPQPLLRGDELARELGIAPGPRLGELLEELRRGQYAGEIWPRASRRSPTRAALAERAERDRPRVGIGSAAMADPDCIFCRIVAGELPATIVDRGRAHDRLHGHRTRRRAGTRS